MVELRWTVPEGTTTERPRLQYRVRPTVIMFGAPSGWSEWMDVPMVVVPLIPHEGEGVRFCTRQSISQDLNFHGITGVFRDGRFWSADMADHWTPGEVTRWEHAAGVPASPTDQSKGGA